MAVANAFRGGFVAVFVFWYSSGIFKAMDSHYGTEFGKYLHERLRENEHMRRDVERDAVEMRRVLDKVGQGKILPQLPAEPPDGGHPHQPLQSDNKTTFHKVSKSIAPLPDVLKTEQRIGLQTSSCTGTKPGAPAPQSCNREEAMAGCDARPFMHLTSTLGGNDGNPESSRTRTIIGALH